MTRLAIALVAAAMLMGIPAAGAADPPDPQAQKLAEGFFRIAADHRKAGKLTEAVEAVNKALEKWPDYLDANFLSAELLIQTRQAQPARERVARIETMINQMPNGPADARTRLDAVLKALDTAFPYPRLWTAMKTRHADRYATLGEEPAEAGLSSTELAFRRAAALKPDDRQIAGQWDGAKKSLPALPAPADKPDPKGAAMFHDEARKHLAAKRYDQARNSLELAVPLDCDLADLWADLGECHLQLKNTASAVACLLKARELIRSRNPTAETSAIDRSLNQADPKLRKVGELDRAFIAEARSLADLSSAAGDKQTADEIEALLGMLGSSVTASDGPKPKGRLPDLMHPSVKCTVKPPEAKFVRTSNTVELKLPADTKENTLDLVFESLCWGKQLSATWRIEELGKPVPGKKYGAFNLRFWPNWGADLFCADEGPFWQNLYGWSAKEDYIVTRQASPEAKKAILNEARAYEVTWEKDGPVFRLKVNGEILTELESKNLPKMTGFPRKSVSLTMRGSGLKGEPYHLKATLLDFSCSPDCIKEK